MGRTWNEDLLELLITILEKHPHIWDTSHSKFTKSKKIRHIWWKEITKKFNGCHKEKPFNQIEVLTKWNAMKIQFQKERARAFNLERDTSGWKYYDSLKFLGTQPTQKLESLYKVQKPHVLRKSVKSEDDLETDIVSIGSISRDENELQHGQIQAHGWEPQKSFGNYIAVEVMHLEPDLQLKAKKIIFDVLIDLQCEQHKRKRDALVE